MNSEYQVVNLNSLIANKELSLQDAEAFVFNKMETYSCPVNSEVEYFLKHNSVEFTKQKKSITYFVFEPQSNELAGYFTLTIKPITINPDCLSKRVVNKLKRFGKYNQDTSSFNISAYLIAQLGKNYSLVEDKQISGDDLLELAEESLKEVQFRIGCGFIFLECENKKKLKDFYESHSYKRYGERPSENSGITLLQYIKSF